MIERTAGHFGQGRGVTRDRARDRRYLGQASTRVTIRDFTVLGELIVSLADGELVSVDGPWWELRPDSPVYREALAAARDATARAGEYAEAFGGRLGDLLEAVRAHFAVPASAQFVRTATTLAASAPSLELFTATPASLQAL